MIIGVPKETKVHEYRVGLTPASVHELTRRGHEVRVESGAGAAIDFSDADYRKAGAKIAAGAAAPATSTAPITRSASTASASIVACVE